MKIYKGKIDITPQKALKLGGFAHRTDRFLGIKNRLNLRVLIIEVDNTKVAIFSADILFWSEKIVDRLKDAIERTYKIRKESIIFSATHNHSGPLLADDMLPEIGEYSEEYANYLEKRSIDLLELALTKPLDVYAELVEDEMYFGINRRLREDNEVLMKPNYLGAIDNTCSIVKFRNIRSGNLESLLINYALHANVTDDNYVNTDYPGIVCNNLEKEYSGSVVLFLQGFTGNIRPKLIVGEEFFRGTFDTVQNLSSQIKNRLIEIINNKGKRIEPEIGSYMFSTKVPIDTSIQKVNKLFKEEDNDYFLRWLDFLKKNPEKETNETYLLVQGIKLSRNLIIIALNGEVVTEYGLYLRHKYPNTNFLILGYSNGMIGYIATKEQLLEGGYESEDFIYYFGLPGKYSIDIDKIVKDSMIECTEKLIKDVI